MGFGFNLIVFPLLILTTIGLLIFFFATKNKIILKILAAFWGGIILLFSVVTIILESNRPLRLTKKEITGNYRVEKTLYPGKNADWQFDHYRFTITGTDSIYFYVTNRDTILKTYSAKLKYSSGPPDLWTIQTDTIYHVIKHPPTLYRGHSKFYYVFRSDVYGNIFFRKVEP